jgi:hypothetical protein
LVEIGKLFNLPTLIATNKANGPHGPVLHFIREELPNAKTINLEGELIYWDNEDFQKAVKNLGVKRIIIAGPGIDSCMGFTTLSLLD